MSRKLLFLVFTDEPCKSTHAFWYALDLHRHGHRVTIVLEGPGTACLARAADPAEKEFADLVAQVREAGLLAGVCATAARGCGNPGAGDAAAPTNADRARQAGIPLLGGMNGHAAIDGFVAEGYEIVTF